MDIPAGWEQSGGALVREFRFENFAVAMRFINAVAALAERYNHHPEIWNNYATVRLALSTHDAGGTVTDRDRALALEINNL